MYNFVTFSIWKLIYEPKEANIILQILFLNVFFLYILCN